MKRKGSTTSIVIATVAGLSVLGVAGYRMMSGDCSSCPLTGTATTATTATTVATPSTGDSCCPLTDGQKQAEVTPVATETDGQTCGSEKACGLETTCTDKADQVEMVSTAGESCEIACSEKAACDGEADKVELASTTAKTETCGTTCDAGKELAKAPE